MCPVLHRYRKYEVSGVRHANLRVVRPDIMKKGWKVLCLIAISENIMGKIKAVKVATPGSGKKAPGRGRPKKVKERCGTSRKGNYRHRYLQETLDKAIEAVKEKRMSLREAALHFKVPRTTLNDRVLFSKNTLGRPTVLSMKEEKIFVERLMMMGDWGFPLTTKDMCHLIKDYLDSLGRTTRFTDNKPGPEFVKGFLKRHRQLSQRRANLVKRARAALSLEIVTDFFDNYNKVAAGVPPENVFNYDETNLQDNPGKKLLILKEQNQKF